MDTTNKHIGNVLSGMSDKDVKEVFEQYNKKCNRTKETLFNYLDEVLNCDKFDYDGNIADD